MGTGAITHDGTQKVTEMPIGVSGAMPVIIGDRAVVPLRDGINQTFIMSLNSNSVEEVDCI